MVRDTIARVIGGDATGAVFRRVARWSGVLCLNYHRVGNDAGSPFDRGLWSADEKSFDAQVRFLVSNFDVVSPPDLPGLLARRRGRSVMITFDDGYRDNYDAALPILRRHGAKATFFVATGFIDRPSLPWWDEIAWMVRSSPLAGLPVSKWLAGPVMFDEPDREMAVRACLKAYKRMAAGEHEAYLAFLGRATASGRHEAKGSDGLWMTWDMLREMRDAGMTIAGHTVTHPVLARLPVEQQRHEIVECGRRLADELGEPMRYFSYPVGGPDAFGPDTRACLRNAGVQFAFSYYGGFRKFDEWDDLDVRRFAVEREMTPASVAAVVTLPWLFGPARRAAGGRVAPEMVRTREE
jgi:peptidoglycan/xylan/chitin deacetylase (PgdA/CDA1 family)